MHENIWCVPNTKSETARKIISNQIWIFYLLLPINSDTVKNSSFKGDGRHKMLCCSSPYLSHVNDSHCQSLVAQNSAVLVPLSALQHNLEFVAVSLQEVWVLQSERDN